MTSAVSKFITMTLCDNRGCLDFQSLSDIVAQSFTVADSVLQTVLFDDGKIAIEQGSKQKAARTCLSPDSLVVAKTSLRLCQSKNGECSQCARLHLCKFLVCGKCRFGSKCKHPHSLFSGKNLEVLKSQGLQDLTEKQLFQLLLQNDPGLLPEVCSFYNKGDGLHGSCSYAQSCTRLHICQHFLQGDCKFGPSCKRVHRFDVGDKKLFQSFSQENVENLSQIYRNRFIIAAPKERPDAVSPGKVKAAPVSPAAPPAVARPAQPTPDSKPKPSAGFKPMSASDRNEICLFFLRRQCSYKERCARVHWHLPYRWQVLDGDGVTWKDLPNMEEMERAYCDPKYDTSSMDEPSPLSKYLSLFSPKSSPSVDFMTMKYESSPVRRLSTASSISKPPHFILTTEWLWYWKDDAGQWLEFGQSSANAKSSITSPTLENMYCEDTENEIQFSAGNQQYVLHFKAGPGTRMYQQNVKFKTKREVRRRPRFVSLHDAEEKRNSLSSHSPGSSAAESLPSHWDKINPPDYEYKLIPLSKSVKEYDLIEKLFKRTMRNHTINQIQRIQNPSLWKVFHWQREQMAKKNEGKSVNEQYLFHGTDRSLVEAICEQNFDWRMCGIHGTAYGKGSYFARDASYSDKYCKSNFGQRKVMFVALILVGDYTKGSSRYSRPPVKPGSKTLYDSCVDNEGDPSIYVVFEKQQIYPEYLIDYS